MMLNDKQTSVEIEDSREWIENKPYIDDSGIWVPCSQYTPAGTKSLYKQLISKELFIEAYNKWIRR